jgi:hypothetical protein
MTQLTPEHFELHSMNKAKKFEDNKKSLDNEIKDLDYAIDRLGKITDEIRRTFHLFIPNIYLSRIDGIINKFVDVLANLKTKNGTTELTQNQLAKQMIKKGFIEKESDLVNLHLQIKKDK